MKKNFSQEGNMPTTFPNLKEESFSLNHQEAGTKFKLISRFDFNAQFNKKNYIQYKI